MNSLIKIEGLSFTYPGAQKAALSRVDLAIGQGSLSGSPGLPEPVNPLCSYA